MNLIRVIPAEGSGTSVLHSTPVQQDAAALAIRAAVFSCSCCRGMHYGYRHTKVVGRGRIENLSERAAVSGNASLYRPVGRGWRVRDGHRPQDRKSVV